ncbi:MAG: TAT-variant-translocated molybdopterin oxidoreductase [Planctomycetota bacterium]
MQDRRSFLKLAGFTFFTGCSRGIETKAIPLLIPVEEVTPGRATWYASLCNGCSAGCGVLVKNRDGRPIKLEGNAEHPASGGGLCAAGQAQVLGVYDAERLRAPLADGEEATWEAVDTAITEKLSRIGGGDGVRFLTGTLNSPTVRDSIAEFGRRFGNFAHVSYDTLSCSALLDVHEEMFSTRALPQYRFDLAEVIVSFDADFLGTWVSPVEYTRAYAAGRNPEKGGPHSYHVQYEARMSLTGANADLRVPAAPDEIRAAVAQLAFAVAKRAGKTVSFEAQPTGEIEALAARLTEAARGTTLVVSGVDDLDTQRLVAFTNHVLGNYGKTLSTERLSRQKQGSKAGLETLRKELAAGRVKALFIAGCNPAYDLVEALDLSNVDLVVDFAERANESTGTAHFVCPDHHPLEAWGDSEPLDGLLTVSQPALRPLHATRALVESLAAWDGKLRSAHAIMQAFWKKSVFPRRESGADFEGFWTQSLHDGFARLAAGKRVTVKEPEARALKAPAPSARADGELALVLYPTIGMGDGRHAHNPWLHELPDPVTKVVWDNYACLSPATAARIGVEEADLVEVGGLKLPVFVQPGQHDDVVAVPLGYGRQGTNRFARIGPEWIEGEPTIAGDGPVGVRAEGLAATSSAAVKRVRGSHVLATTQRYHSMTVPDHLGGDHRATARETTLKEYREPHGDDAHAHHPTGELWPDDHKFETHHWGMAVDLSKCTGCSACVVGCQSENNLPVVGKDEVARSREMHWLRIDRYYGDDGVSHQPMLCQQCDNAPCETVCPVLATVQSSEGLNQQVYNRCVGTRYCANNCPYKARRFNWFNYKRDDELEKLVLNPDVVVRSRGVMEKCTFCIQRIAEGKADAKREGRPVKDGDVQPACMQSCPASAIVFGDLNDPESAVSKAWSGRRNYRVLEELNVKPCVGYLTLVRNRDV